MPPALIAQVSKQSPGSANEDLSRCIEPIGRVMGLRLAMYTELNNPTLTLPRNFLDRAIDSSKLEYNRETVYVRE